MSDPPAEVDAGEGTDQGPDRGRGTGLAPWQKVVGIIALVVVVLVVIGLLIGGGHTSPVQHGAGL